MQHRTRCFQVAYTQGYSNKWASFSFRNGRPFIDISFANPRDTGSCCSSCNAAYNHFVRCGIKLSEMFICVFLRFLFFGTKKPTPFSPIDWLASNLHSIYTDSGTTKQQSPFLIKYFVSVLFVEIGRTIRGFFSFFTSQSLEAYSFPEKKIEKTALLFCLGVLWVYAYHIWCVWD